MKKQWLLAFASVVAVAACTKTPTPAVDFETDDPTEAPAPIKFGTNVHFVETKAAVDEWAGQDLYVYGFIAGADGTFNYSSAEIDNVRASAPAASVPPAAPTLSGPINVYDASATDINNVPLDNTYYYYKDGTPVGASNGVRDFLYSFYGYYVGTATMATTAPTKTANDVTLGITIDGTQDIMLAKAVPADDITAQNIKNKANTAAMNPGRAYSAYSARRGLTPNLVFKHQLSRFVFNIKSGNNKGQLVMVESIKVRSLNQATLTIAPTPALVASGTYSATSPLLELKNIDGTKLPALSGTPLTMPADAIVPSINPAPAVPGDFVRVGESVMVIPGEAKYYFEVTIVQFKLTDPNEANVATNRTPLKKFEPQTYEIDLSNTTYDTALNLTNGQAAPGFQYNVDLTIYGPEEILINVTLTPWTEYTPHIGIDPDKD